MKKFMALFMALLLLLTACAAPEAPAAAETPQTPEPEVTSEPQQAEKPAKKEWKTLNVLMIVFGPLALRIFWVSRVSV